MGLYNMREKLNDGTKSDTREIAVERARQKGVLGLLGLELECLCPSCSSLLVKSTVLHWSLHYLPQPSDLMKPHQVKCNPSLGKKRLVQTLSDSKSVSSKQRLKEFPDEALTVSAG